MAGVLLLCLRTRNRRHLETWLNLHDRTVQSVEYVEVLVILITCLHVFKAMVQSQATCSARFVTNFKVFRSCIADYLR